MGFNKTDYLTLSIISILYTIGLIYLIIISFKDWIKQNFILLIITSILIVVLLTTIFLKKRKELYNQVYKAIKKFKLSLNYRDETGYHGELIGWLKTKFPNIKGELQTGSSRPDIVINNIAIEVKGPTDTQALDTLASKCLRYSRYYKHLIIVLFKPRFSERYYNEVVEGIKEHFPNVKVIRKE